jgi:hypothetical protein
MAIDDTEDLMRRSLDAWAEQDAAIRGPLMQLRRDGMSNIQIMEKFTGVSHVLERARLSEMRDPLRWGKMTPELIEELLKPTPLERRVGRSSSADVGENRETSSVAKKGGVTRSGSQSKRSGR